MSDSISKSMGETRAQEAAEDLEFQRNWALLDCTGDACEKCSRVRVCNCPNGKRRCEKCGWSPEQKEYVWHPAGP